MAKQLTILAAEEKLEENKIIVWAANSSYFKIKGKFYVDYNKESCGFRFSCKN
jgi:erythromycin esterase-like protein